MDPITGVGLVASVIQLLTFSIDAVKTCREIYQKGSVSDYSNLDVTTGHLAGLTNSLQQSLQSSGTRFRALTREEKDLVELARKCEDCAKALQKELGKLQTKSRASTLEAVRLAARAMRKKSTIDRINQQLQAYQSTLETSLLSRLSQRFDTQGLQTDKSFVNLDKSLQRIITCLANSQTSLNGLVVQESAQTRHCITAQIDRVERLHIDDRRYEEILKSLFYPDISSRQEQVDSQFNGIKDSYDWIFDDPQIHGLGSHDEGYSQQQERRWDDFARWLKSGHGVYWINGKAGSGKSTLMNHICNHSRRLELLGEWSSDRRLLTPTFFFWNAGTDLQKRIDGLLRSLVYQMLKECRELVGCFSNEPLHTWTQSRLLATLLNLLKQSQIPVAICMFIDGLDEFEGQEDAVIKMIDDLADQTHVKVCVSSRPLPAFEEAFGGKPSLRLQDLTFDSIRKYAEVKLSEPIRKYFSPNEYDRIQAEDLVDRIVWRADGVFLWAIIAIRDLYDGLRGHANIDDLAQTLESLPSELENLFMLMLYRIKPVFKRDAAYFLGFAMYEVSNFDYHVDLCTLYFSHSQRELKDRPAHYENIATSELVIACRTLKMRLLSHTAGLLELTPQINGQRIYGKRKDHEPILYMRINFLHRTARDFLLRNDEAKSFLAGYGCSEAQVCLSIARGTLAQVAHFSQGFAKCIDDEWANPVYHPFLASLRQISRAEQILGAAQTKLMQSLDYESLACGYRVSADSDTRRNFNPCAFMIKNGSGNSTDQVGMAAYAGMTRYVCEQLDLPIESPTYLSSFPDLSKYSRDKRNTATLTWSSDFNDSLNQNIDVATGLRSSKYHQALGRCLQWNSDDQLSSQTEVLSENHLLAVTYMLCCCHWFCFDLARVLLKAGADPMVRVELTETEPRMLELRTADSFWHRWLSYLNYLRRDHLKANGGSQGLIFYDQEVEWNIKFNDIFETTKTLLANGADINYQLKEPDSSYPGFYIKGRLLFNERFDISLTASAMFVLEECFNCEPEFRHFASEIEPLVQRPTRKIVTIKLSDDLYTVPELNYEEEKAHPNAEESKMLLCLIEKWEDTGHRDDRDALEAALEVVWRAHHPGVELRERGSSPTVSETSASEDDDDDHEIVSTD